MNSIKASLLALAFLSAAACAENSAERLAKLHVPEGFKLSLFAEGIPDARSMALGEDGAVYVGTRTEGKVYALRDTDRDGKADRVLTVAQGLKMPNGVAVSEGDLYIAEVDRIVKIEDIAAHEAEPPKPKLVTDAYPSDRHHGWKYLRIGPDGKLYVPVGAPCNICLSEKDIYASLTRLDKDGKNLEIYARGLRNSVGFDWNPATGELFMTDNGRDMLGDDVPPEELNAAPKAGLHFGYPYCHGGDIADPEFGARRACKEFAPPAWKFPAHVAALGLRFYRGTAFPEKYRGQLFVAQHGSWNRSTPQGYRVVMVRFENGKPVADEVFAQGWLQADGTVLGRPTDILEMPDGALLVSDDAQGAIYRIVYAP